MNSSSNLPHNTQLCLCMLGHFTIDWYTGILRPLLPLIMVEFSLSTGGTAMIPAILGIIVAFIQPVGAILGERLGEKKVIVMSVLLVSIFMPLMGTAKSIAMLYLFLTLGRIGNAFFHPVGAAFVGEMKFKKEHTSMSTFSIGGTIGMALAPVMIVWYVEHFSMKNLYIVSTFGIAVALLCLLFMKEPEKKSLAKQKSGKYLHTKGVKALLGVITLRTVTITSFSALIPLYLNELHYPLTWIGYFLTLGTLSGAAGNYSGALLSDRIGPQKVNIISLAMGTLFGILFLLSKGISMMLLSYILMSFFSFGTMGTNIAYMQNLLPQRKGIASSLSMGISWGMGSIIFMVLSLLIDYIGLYSVMLISVLSLATAAFVALKLPEAHPDLV